MGYSEKILSIYCALATSACIASESEMSAARARFLYSATMNGKADLVFWHMDNRASETDSGGYTYTNESYTNIIDKIGKDPHSSFGYGLTESYLHDALRTYPIRGRSVLVVGSTTPIYESFALYYGASSVTVVEYGRRSSSFPNVRYVTPMELEKRDDRFDACISISSVEHDGLGRYGDALNFRADISSMNKLRNVLIDDAIIFLGVPVGFDAIVDNAHRVYGAHRLPLLIHAFRQIDTFGFEKAKDFERRNWAALHQPIFVLNTSTGSPAPIYDGTANEVDFKVWKLALERAHASEHRYLLCDEKVCQRFLPRVVALPSLVEKQKSLSLTSVSPIDSETPSDLFVASLDRLLRNVKILFDMRRSILDNDALSLLYDSIELRHPDVRIFSSVNSNKRIIGERSAIRGGFDIRVGLVAALQGILQRYDHLRRISSAIVLEATTNGDPTTCAVEVERALSFLSAEWGADVYVAILARSRESLQICIDVVRFDAIADVYYLHPRAHDIVGANALPLSPQAIVHVRFRRDTHMSRVLWPLFYHRRPLLLE